MFVLECLVENVSVSSQLVLLRDVLLASVPLVCLMTNCSRIDSYKGLKCYARFCKWCSVQEFVMARKSWLKIGVLLV